MSRYYLAQVVTEEEYNVLKIGSRFGTGVVVEGLSHENDLILLTVHEMSDEDGEIVSVYQRKT